MRQHLISLRSTIHPKTITSNYHRFAKLIFKQNFSKSIKIRMNKPIKNFNRKIFSKFTIPIFRRKGRKANHRAAAANITTVSYVLAKVPTGFFDH